MSSHCDDTGGNVSTLNQEVRLGFVIDAKTMKRSYNKVECAFNYAEVTF